MAASLILLMQSVFISVVQGVLQSHLCFLGFSQRCLVPEKLLVVPLVRGAKSETTYVVILVKSLS